MDTRDSGWSDEQYEEMLDRVDAVLSAFTDSDQFDDLTRYQKQEASFVIESVAELLYGYEDTTIEECDETSLETVCTRIYPAKVSVEPDHSGAVAPVLAAFFRFLDERDIHPDGERLAAHVEGLGDEIVATAADSANWSPGKPTAMGDSGDPVDLTPKQYRDAMDEALAHLEESDAIGTPGNDQDPSVLDTDQADRFLELYGRLLVYVNDRFDIVPEIDSYEEFSTAFLDEIRPIRDRLYHESDTEEIISEFVAENPADLSEAALSQVEEWVAYEAGRFAVVEHREAETVFLDPEEPRAFGVTAVHEPFSHGFPEQDLPMPVPDVVLLPFEDTIVTDGWLRPDPVLLGVWDIMADTDLDTLDEEARHRYGIAETLPPDDEPERSDAEKLRFYTKNAENRERFADEIQKLRNKNEKLADAVRNHA